MLKVLHRAHTSHKSLQADKNEINKSRRKFLKKAGTIVAGQASGANTVSNFQKLANAVSSFNLRMSANLSAKQIDQLLQVGYTSKKDKTDGSDLSILYLHRIPIQNRADFELLLKTAQKLKLPIHTIASMNHVNPMPIKELPLELVTQYYPELSRLYLELINNKSISFKNIAPSLKTLFINSESTQMPIDELNNAFAQQLQQLKSLDLQFDPRTQHLPDISLLKNIESLHFDGHSIHNPNLVIPNGLKYLSLTNNKITDPNIILGNYPLTASR